MRVELFHQPDGDGKPELLAHGKAVLKGTSGRVSRLPLHGELPGRREGGGKARAARRRSRLLHRRGRAQGIVCP